MDVNIILNKEEGYIHLLFNGYNIIAKTLYNEDLTNKIFELIENELKQDDQDFRNFKQYLTMK